MELLIPQKPADAAHLGFLLQEDRVLNTYEHLSPSPSVVLNTYERLSPSPSVVLNTYEHLSPSESIRGADGISSAPSSSPQEKEEKERRCGISQGGVCNKFVLMTRTRSVINYDVCQFMQSPHVASGSSDASRMCGTAICL